LLFERIDALGYDGLVIAQGRFASALAIIIVIHLLTIIRLIIIAAAVLIELVDFLNSTRLLLLIYRHY
jgi:hypothetical protein